MRVLRNKVAVVTGAGSGIGRATALALAAGGSTVAACDLDGTSAKETAEAIAGTGGTASAHQVDVAREEAMRALVDEVLGRHGVVDIVVNNAGIAAAATPATELSLERFRTIMDVNFWGMVYGSLFFLPHLLERPRANLVNVSSNAGLMAYSRMAPYSASKFAIRGFSESLRMELHRTKVRVSLVCPGATKTSLMAHSPVMEEGQRRVAQAAFDRAWGSSPELVARAVAKAIRKDRPRALAGPDTVAVDLIARLLPGAHSRLLGRGVDTFVDRTLGAGSGG